RGGWFRSRLADVPTRYSPVYVLDVAPSRFRTDWATRVPVATEPSPSRTRSRFADRVDDQPASVAMSDAARERSRPGPHFSSAAISTASFTVEAAGNRASAFQLATAPVARFCTHIAL